MSRAKNKARARYAVLLHFSAPVGRVRHYYVPDVDSIRALMQLINDYGADPLPQGTVLRLLALPRIVRRAMDNGATVMVGKGWNLRTITDGERRYMRSAQRWCKHCRAEREAARRNDQLLPLLRKSVERARQRTLFK
jgi:hypothetical protein